jgi:hypothetical protein
MSTSSTQSRRINRRVDSTQRCERLSRNVSRARPKPVSYNEAYTYALRVAYLHHLLQPRPKRKQYIAAPKPVTRIASTNSIGELVKDFSILKDSKSAKLPHGFMSLLEKRLQGVLVGKEKLPGYNDAAVKRTFAEAYTAFTEEGFRRRMDKERRVEDLVLIFYSNATKALQKGKASDDDSWKSMVDRHVALFVRIISNTLKDHGNDKDRPELMGRLATLEKKLLTDDQDLTVSSGPSDAFVEVIVPLSFDVKDMPMVQVVAKIFGLRNSQVQSDIDANRGLWTEEAALTDLKLYQHCLNADSKRTLRSADFDLEEAYQAWKKAEGPILSQMILDILHVKPELAKSPSGGNKPFAQSKSVYTVVEEHSFSSTSRTSSPLDLKSPYGLDRPIDISSLSLQEDQIDHLHHEEASYTFIPPDTCAYYRCILMHAATFDHLQATQGADDPLAMPPLSKQSLELMTELSIRWRIPQVSRLVLFLDITSQRFMDQEISLEELDAAFEFVKVPPADAKRSGLYSHSVGLDLNDPSHWTVRDLTIYRQTLSNLYNTLLRDLYGLLQHCYEAKPPSVLPVMLILENHIYNNSSFSRSPEQLQEYTEELERGLREKAAEVYRSYLEAEVPHNQEEWQFSHVVKLGKSVVKLCQKIQKRYQKNPTIMGVNPLTILVETMFPSFENDAGELIQRILFVARSKGTPVDIEDGFQLYRELAEIRRIHRDALPGVQFAFHIEGCLDDFVWRWIRLTETKMVGSVDEAISQDGFKVRAERPSDEERHSVSVIDIFRLFNDAMDQVFKLEWDDDVHHSKFMTSLSKSFGIGLARYCEILEQRFTSEMSRASPAQEAAFARSKHDWMQLAKDAWNNKEKIEPFQFYPEVRIYSCSQSFC